MIVWLNVGLLCLGLMFVLIDFVCWFCLNCLVVAYFDYLGFGV